VTVAEAEALARPETFDSYQKLSEHYAGIRASAVTRGGAAYSPLHWGFVAVANRDHIAIIAPADPH
jgi:hypothetical protein